MNYERTLRRVRQRIFDYSPAKQDQATRIIGKLKAKLTPRWRAESEARQSEAMWRLWA